MEEATRGEPDPTVVELARRGDTNAFARLVQHYQMPVYNLAYRMLGNAAEAEDAAQETFLRAYARLRGYKPDSRFTPWLLSIAAHYCIDRLRRRRRIQWLSLDADNVGESLPAPGPDPEATALAQEQADQVQRLLQKLPPAYRAVVVLKYWNGLPVEEIAQATGDSVSAVKVKLFRARKALAKTMENESRPASQAPHGLEKAIGDVR